MEKPSFLRSMWEGIKGYIKGAVAGGLIGAVIVGAIGAITGTFLSPETVTGTFTNLLGSSATNAITGAIGTGTGATIAMAGMSGAVIGSSIFAGIGGLAGAVTGVVKSRETPQVAPEELVALGQGAALQGVGIGYQIAQAQGQETSVHRDRLAKQRAAVAMASATAQTQVH